MTCEVKTLPLNSRCDDLNRPLTLLKTFPYLHNHHVHIASKAGSDRYRSHDHIPDDDGGGWITAKDSAS